MLTHADDGSLIVHDNTLSLQRVSAPANNLSDLLIEWVGKANVSHNATFKESEWSDALGSVYNLVWDDKVAWLDLLLKGTDSRERNDAANTDGAKGGNVGAVWDLVWCKRVVCAVTRKEGNNGVLVLEDGDWRRRSSPWSVDVQAGDWSEAINLREASAANNGDVDWAWEEKRVSIGYRRLRKFAAYHRRCLEDQPSCIKR